MPSKTPKITAVNKDEKSPKYRKKEIKKHKPLCKFLLENFNSALIKDCGKLFNINKIKVFEVKEYKPQKSVAQEGNLMLYHGSKEANSILKSGFENSPFGFFGPGVYMTECPDVATMYADHKLGTGESQKDRWVFLNETLISSKEMKTVNFEQYSKMDKESKEKNNKFAFTRYAKDNSPDLNFTRDFVKDKAGRLHRKAPIDCNSVDDEYILDTTNIKPRFLFLLEGVEKNKEAWKIYEEL